MAKIAQTTLRVHDEAMGIDRKVVEGQPVPPELVDAYHAAGGTTDDGPAQTKPAKYTDAHGDEHELPVATTTVTVHDEQLGTDRKIFAGTAVPPELLDAYHAATGGPAEPDEAPAGKYDGVAKADLEAEVDRRDLDVDGTGANGNVLVEDLVKALEADDASKEG